MMKYLLGAGLALLLTACAASAPKPIVQQPLKLSGPSDVQTYTCGEQGCDEKINRLCGDRTANILDKKFVDKSTDSKDHATGVWRHIKNQSTVYKYRCLD